MNAEEKQALIKHCKMNILQAKGILPTLEGIAPDSEVARKVRKELELQEIALAALTAKPLELSQVERWRSVDQARAQSAYRILAEKAIRDAGYEVKE